MAELDDLLAKLRTEAQKRGDDWLRQLIPQTDADPAPAIPRRSRRARAPSRLSPSPAGKKSREVERGRSMAAEARVGSSGGRRQRSPSPQPSTSAAPAELRQGRRRQAQTVAGRSSSMAGSPRRGSQRSGMTAGARVSQAEQASERGRLTGPGAQWGRREREDAAGPCEGVSAVGASFVRRPRESAVWREENVLPVGGNSDTSAGTLRGGALGGRAGRDMQNTEQGDIRVAAGTQEARFWASETAVGGEATTMLRGTADTDGPSSLVSLQVPGHGSTTIQDGEGTRREEQPTTSNVPGTDQTATNTIALNIQQEKGPGSGEQTGPAESFFECLRQIFSQWQKGQGGVETGVLGGNKVAPELGKDGQTAATRVTDAASSISSLVGQGEASSGEKSKEKKLPLSDSAKGSTYVCYEGPLGAHLKQEIKEKIWKREYVDIFTLLPLERFGIDRYEKGKEHRKEEDEERRRFRLIPRTFGNWLQAFSILASVIGEKHPEVCSALFCYLDGIWEAHRVYGGYAWLRYDEQFRQRIAVRADLNWDHRDIGLWMRLMNNKGYQGYTGAVGGSSQPFPSGSGGHSSTPAGAHKKGVCWLFNDSQCKWGASCRFRHECSWCGGNHPVSRCFKKSKGAGSRAKEGFGKGGDSGEPRGDASMVK
ncbi:uncharacterized protein LOC121394617 [Xenopus laevis]|uniref:Uncharacterized protein LOC121394617 n=1 Tax=Xenopus laevis TaxID=8355 RepID=A0A8J1L0D4_XENLA|nr:uncharacterized protein LOC121394617 [Xenopus laevis]